MSKNPLDMLKENNTWEDISRAYMGRYGSTGRKGLIGAAILGFLGARENRMIRDSNLKLRELEKLKILENAKITQQHERTQKVVEEFEKYQNTPDYFELMAERQLDEADPNFWTTAGGELGKNSEWAQAKRKEDIKNVSDELRDNLFAKMGYRTNEKGIYEVDPITKLPKIYVEDDPATEVNEREIRKAEILRRQTLEEAALPFEDYYFAQQQAYLQPKNRSWAAAGIQGVKNIFGFSPKDDPTTTDIDESLTLIERDAIKLEKIYKKQYIDNSKQLDPFIVPTTFKGESAWDVRGKDTRTGLPIYRTADELFGPKDDLDIGFSQEEAKRRINAMNLDTRLFQNVLERINLDSSEKKYKPSDLSNIIYQERIDFNAMREQLEDGLQIFDDTYFQSIDRRILPKNMSKERFSLMIQGLDYKTPSNPNSKEIVDFNYLGLSANEKRMWDLYKDERASRADKLQGVTNEMRNNFNALTKITSYIEANNEAKAAGKEPVFSELEINVLRAEAQKMTLSGITTIVYSEANRDLSDTQQLRYRASVFDSGSYFDVLTVDDNGNTVMKKAYSEEQYVQFAYEAAAYRARKLNKSFDAILGID
tara:strand:- start:5575 stop:7359 length:1785 start_codon:yes stop_codon:yes gene_type:complete